MQMDSKTKNTLFRMHVILQDRLSLLMHAVWVWCLEQVLYSPVLRYHLGIERDQRGSRWTGAYAYTLGQPQLGAVLCLCAWLVLHPEELQSIT